VEPGEIFGLLGHNGAGTSTTLGVLLGHVYPDRGEAFVGGVSVQRERAQALAKVGAIFEAPRFYDYLSGWRNLEIFTSYSAIVPRAELEEAVAFVGLTQRIHDKVGTYSQGMRQRLGLAQALLPAPDVVLLDEPTNGLDPEGIAEMRELIQRLNRERRITVLFCSHLLSEVEQLCDRVAILNQGRMLYQGRWHELAPKGSRFRVDAEPWETARALLNGAELIRETPQRIIEIPPGSDVADLVARFVAAGVKVRAIEPERQTLEQLYLEQVHKP
jgi:ABC-2 type transport system ATP-binding protein